MENNWRLKHAAILLDFSNQLDRYGIRHFILRNYEGLPYENKSKDVDIVYEPSKQKIIHKLLLDTFKKHDIIQYHYVKHGHSICYWGIHHDISIEIDLLCGFYIRGYEVFPFDELYKNVKKHNGLSVLSSHYEVILLFLFKIIGWKQIKSSYQIEIRNAIASDYSLVLRNLSKTIGQKNAEFIIALLQDEKYDAILQISNKIKHSFKRISFFRNPVSTIINRMKFLWIKLFRIIICPRKYQNFIAVEAPDGTGKTTFIEGLQNAIAYYYVSDKSKCHIYHHRPTLLPNLGALGEKAGIKEQDKDFTNPHRGKPKGFFSSFVRMIYYWLDYVIGVPFLLRKDVQFDRFTIYDRYVYDFLIDPYRMSIKLPCWLLRLFTKLVLQPRIVFVLLTDAEIIYRRKQELTIEEINRQLEEFVKLAQSDKRFVVIDATQSPEKMVEQAMKVIVEWFTQRIL